MALVEDGALLGSRQLDMGNSGLHDGYYDMKSEFGSPAYRAASLMRLTVIGGPSTLGLDRDTAAWKEST